MTKPPGFNAFLTVLALAAAIPLGLAVAFRHDPKPAGTAATGRGGECVLDSGLPQLFAAADESTNGRLMQLCRVNDTVGISRMVAAGQVFIVDQGTRGLVIAPGIFTTEVRLRSGRHAGEAVIVPSEFVKPPPP